MNNMNQIYIQMSQLSMQIMNNINIVITNMNQLMNNMNLMNKLINDIGISQNNNYLFNINNQMNFNNKQIIKEGIIIQFEQPKNKISVPIQCYPEDKLRRVIDIYKNYIHPYYDEKFKFIYKGKVLNTDLDLTVKEIGILSESKILVVDPDDNK